MLEKSKIKNVFFDLDHTLWDFEKNSALTFEKILKPLNIQIELSEFLHFYDDFNHKYWKLYRENRISQNTLRQQRLIKTFEAIDYSTTPDLINKLSEQYIENLSTFTHLFEGTISVLEYLKKKYTLHIISNGFEVVQHHKINNSNLSSYFQNVFTAEKVGYKKPHPIIFEKALELSKAIAAESVMIGDSLEADVLGAQNAGMEAIHFNSHHEAEHDHSPVIYNLEEIKRLL